MASPKRIEIADGNSLVIRERITVDFIISNLTLSDEFMVAEELSVDVIIGASTLQKWKIKLDFDKEEVIINPDVCDLLLI